VPPVTSALCLLGPETFHGWCVPTKGLSLETREYRGRMDKRLRRAPLVKKRPQALSISKFSYSSFVVLLFPFYVF
jgi:hypothetical protein